MTTSRTRPNLSQIATLLDVSAATVSNALSGKGRVSEELAERIRAKAAELGYMPSQAGRALRTGRSQVLGLVLPDIANPLFPQIAQAIEHAASNAGYGVLIADSRGDVAMQTKAIQQLQDRGVDGIVIIPRRGTRVADIGSPVAVIDSPSTPGNTVSADHWQGGQLVARHLLDLGHRDFLLIGNNPASNVQNDRIGGIKSCLPASISAQILWVETHESRHGNGCHLGLAEKVRDGVTAFAAVSDLQALRALTELQGAGVRVPDDASVTGFDDLIWSSAITPALTTVRMDMAAIAEQAISALSAVIEAQNPADQVGSVMRASMVAKAEQPSVPMDLVIRQTTGPAPSQASKTPPAGDME
ncbi:LacI family DNA-binding transcriptional regulator [Roseibium litorale]|uniref:LacI family DNA-binding transcriptional regulator n=1 Tax=Roseibium litorale TaxID=2803841 RepID=A0ABR9CP13_9HYPH|nr:LacI family DNA-binding transcriptional regulator [Roseibium litorale]MBD8892590.1 LacI family DNA-binding transcriptional regulator [Roseibium litorale]